MSQFSDPQDGFVPPQKNGLGTAGFVVSLVGFVLTCGLLCPLGLLLSLFGLGRQPRGLAIAGTVIGVLGSGLLALVLLLGGSFLLAASSSGSWRMAQRDAALQQACEAIDAAARAEGGTLDTGRGNQLAETFDDRFGRPLRYELTSDGYLVRSAGADGTFETGDDVRAVVSGR